MIYNSIDLLIFQPPEPAMIRSLPVLKKSFRYVLEKYNRTNDYRYICDQLKAIRQDLTVSRLSKKEPFLSHYFIWSQSN